VFMFDSLHDDTQAFRSSACHINLSPLSQLAVPSVHHQSPVSEDG